MLLDHVPVGAEIAQLPIRAGGEGKPQVIEPVRRRRRRTRAADRALRPQGRKAIPIGPVGFEPADVDVHTMRRPPLGLDRALAHDLAHALIASHLPAHRDRLGHAAEAVGGERLARQARPKYKAIGRGLAGRHPQGKGIAAPGPSAVVRREKPDGIGTRGLQQPPTRQHGPAGRRAVDRQSEALHRLNWLPTSRARGPSRPAARVTLGLPPSRSLLPTRSLPRAPAAEPSRRWGPRLKLKIEQPWSAPALSPRACSRRPNSLWPCSPPQRLGGATGVSGSASTVIL